MLFQMARPRGGRDAEVQPQAGGLVVVLERFDDHAADGDDGDFAGGKRLEAGFGGGRALSEEEEGVWEARGVGAGEEAVLRWKWGGGGEGRWQDAGVGVTRGTAGVVG